MSLDENLKAYFDNINYRINSLKSSLKRNYYTFLNSKYENYIRELEEISLSEKKKIQKLYDKQNLTINDLDESDMKMGQFYSDILNKKEKINKSLIVLTEIQTTIQNDQKIINRFLSSIIIRLREAPGIDIETKGKLIKFTEETRIYINGFIRNVINYNEGLYKETINDKILKYEMRETLEKFKNTFEEKIKNLENLLSNFIKIKTYTTILNYTNIEIHLLESLIEIEESYESILVCSENKDFSLKGYCDVLNDYFYEFRDYITAQKKRLNNIFITTESTLDKELRMFYYESENYFKMINSRMGLLASFILMKYYKNGDYMIKLNSNNSILIDVNNRLREQNLKEINPIEERRRYSPEKRKPNILTKRKRQTSPTFQNKTKKS